MLRSGDKSIKRWLALASLLALMLTPLASAKRQSTAADDEIARLVRRLSPTQVSNTTKPPGNETEIETRIRLRTIAQGATEQRQKVIKALIEFIEETFNEGAGPAKGAAWWVGAELLGELKAIEAIDVLVNYLGYDYRYQNGFMDYANPRSPSCEALVEIGEPAVPKLSGALSNGKYMAVRMDAARTLGYIGGSAAKAALEQAFARETNMKVKAAIGSAWSDIVRKSISR